MLEPRINLIFMISLLRFEFPHVVDSKENKAFPEKAAAVL